MIFMTCNRQWILSLLLGGYFVLAISCLGGGIDKTGSVVKHHQGKVLTQGGGSFVIGVLPKTWQQKKIKERAILFSNSEDGASITVSTWCKLAFDDAPLPILSDQLYIGLTEVKHLESANHNLAGHDALRTSASGLMDGAPVYLRSYVLKMQNCVFDFLYVSTPTVFDSVQDFENLVHGFGEFQGSKS